MPNLIDLVINGNGIILGAAGFVFLVTILTNFCMLPRLIVLYVSQHCLDVTKMTIFVNVNTQQCCFIVLGSPFFMGLIALDALFPLPQTWLPW
jgi:uncharacterized protein with PQ loop repeat